MIFTLPNEAGKEDVPTAPTTIERAAETTTDLPVPKSNDGGIWPDIRWIARLLRLSGIHLPSSTPCSRRSWCTTALVGTAAFALSLAYVASEVAFCGVTGFVGHSVVLCMGSTLCLALLLWAVLMRRRGRISRLGDRAAGGSARLRRLATIAAAYSLLAPPVASLGGVLLSHDDDGVAFYLHCYLFGGTGGVPLLTFFLTVENYTQLFLPNLATALVVLLYERLGEVVAAFARTDLRLARREDVLASYRRIRRSYDLLSEITSLPVFLIITQKFLTLFFTLTVILSSKRKQVLLQLVQGCFLALNAALTLVVIILSGSRIQESHAKVRGLLMTESSAVKHDLLCLLKTFVEKEDMVMVAAGMIPLNRSLFLKIGAALVTYGVLIVQLDTSGN